MRDCLSKLGHESNHQVEQTNGLDEGKAQDGVREQLASQGRVAGRGADQGGEDKTDTDASTRQTDSGRAHANVLRDLDHSLSNLRAVHAAAGDLEGLG